VVPLSIPLHHPDAGDPVLLAWIKHRLDELISLEPAAVAVVLGVVIVAIPVSILLLYALQRRGAPRR
jgi:hypothetical protein